MEWLFGRKYKVFVINTLENPNLFLWDNWKVLKVELDTIIRLVDENNTFIRTFQSYEFENRWLGFGRMKWNQENNKKWTTKYRGKSDKKLSFYATEIWSPDWNFYYKNGKTPNIFINLYANENYKRLREGVVIAIPKKVFNKNEKTIRGCIEKLSLKIDKSSISEIERKWMPSRKFSNRIEDMNVQELESIVFNS